MVLDLTPSARHAYKKWHPRRGPWRGLCGHNLAQGFEHTGADVARLNADSAERKNRVRQGDVPDAVEAQRGQMRGKTAFYFGHSSPQMVNKTYARAVPQADAKRFFGGVKKRPAFCLGALVYLNSSKSSAEGRWVAGLSRYEVTGIVMRPV